MTFQPMALVLLHHPVIDRHGAVVTSAVTNLDIHDLARLVTSYGLCRYYLVTPADEQRQLIERIIAHWREGAGARFNPDRQRAFAAIRVVSSLQEVLTDWQRLTGQCGRVILTGARHEQGTPPATVRQMAKAEPLLLVFGTGHGLAPSLYTPDRPCLAAIRPGNYNHLSVRTAAAIVLDRLLGDNGRILPLP